MKKIVILTAAIIFFTAKPVSAEKVDVIPYISYGLLMSPNLSGFSVHPNYSSWKGGINFGVQGYFVTIKQNFSIGADIGFLDIYSFEFDFAGSTQENDLYAIYLMPLFKYTLSEIPASLFAGIGIYHAMFDMAIPDINNNLIKRSDSSNDFGLSIGTQYTIKKVVPLFIRYNTYFTSGSDPSLINFGAGYVISL